jgi:hypothetical protein
MCVAIMATLAALPFGSDQTSFLYIGELLHRGHSLYVDAVDVKPPLIYMISWLQVALFDGNQLIIKLLDICLHTFVAWRLYRLCKDSGYRSSVAVTSALLYSMYYVSASYADVMQPENYFCVILVLFYTLLQNQRRAYNSFAIGVMVALAFLIKYPLGIIGVAAIPYLFVHGKQKIINFVVCCLGFVAPLLIMYGYLNATNSLPYYVEIFQYAMHYAFSNASFEDKVNYTFYSVSRLVVKHVSVFGIACASMVVFSVIRGKSTSLEKTSTVLFALLLCTLVLEGKYFIYQSYRMLVPFVLLFAVGLHQCYHMVPRIFSGVSRKTQCLIVILLFVIAGPFPRFIIVNYRHAVCVSSQLNFLSLFDGKGQTIGESSVALIEAMQRTVKPSDTLGFLALYAGFVPQFVPNAYRGPVVDAHFYTAHGVSDRLREQYRQFLRTCHVVVVDTSDVQTIITLHNLTSMQVLRQDTAMYRWFEQHFRRVTTAATCVIYVRKESTEHNASINL